MASPPTDPMPGDAVAIVTGGSWGAGREVASALASRGYAVVVVYLRDQRRAEAVVDEILAADGTALAVRADVTDELDVERLFEETAAAFGGVDVVVQTARRGSAVVVRQAARRVRRGGAIVAVSSSRVDAGVLLERWRRSSGADQGMHGRERPRDPRAWPPTETRLGVPERRPMTDATVATGVPGEGE